MDDSAKTTKPLLVFVNPTSGTKLAHSMLKKILKPELQKRNIDFELVMTREVI
jgi:diacylglycerol kinase family enzyme